MSADPMGGLLGGAIDQHVLGGTPPGLADVPALEQHELDVTAGRAPDFWIDPNIGDPEQHLYEIGQMLASANALTGLTQARSDYGFIGTGQTVAVIDTGIAYDHYALGGGLGTSFRVVGGWDFTEGDANPYDDPNGSHGTHVSGIIGGQAGTSSDSGVAPGVDLVGLRVFNDSGAGYFSWVEQALQWVHQNRNAFDNPITAVNLSLGATWNSETIPSWAMLEDEFAQLETDGIFISVSAGNSFTSYNTTGLSYPAASPHVVPVMSVDDSGLLSYFSQRAQRAIAAPGRSIRSTVPDYAGNHNGTTDDWANFSGTSMAAPYVAGASVLVREAMEFVGYTDITQDTIYDHMIATADRFYDSATSQYYNRLDVGAAIDALIPDDDYGSSVGDAYDLGTLTGDNALGVSGLIGKLSDVDYFTFTAGANGTVHIAASSSDGGFLWDARSLDDPVVEDDDLAFNVAAGQSYTVGLAADGRPSHYELRVDCTVDEPEPPAAAPAVVVKTIVRGDGAVFSLDSDGWLSVDGSRLWSNTYDFALDVDGTLYWQGTGGLLQHQIRDGAWTNIDDDVTKFTISNAGAVYSLGADGWLSVDASRLWANTSDFELGSDQSLYWQGTTGLVQHRLWNGAWQTIDYGASQFAVRDDGQVYSLGADGWLKVNGSRTWTRTQDFALTQDQTLYWHSTTGLLQQLPDYASWQTLGDSVTKFAVRHDGVVYFLTGDGHVNVDGIPTWSNVRDIRTNSAGWLVVDGMDGTVQEIAGRFAMRREGTVQSVAVGRQGLQTAETSQTACLSMAFMAQSLGPACDGSAAFYVTASPVRSYAEADATLLAGTNFSRSALFLHDPDALPDGRLGQADSPDSSSVFATVAGHDETEDASSVNDAVDSLFEQIGKLS